MINKVILVGNLGRDPEIRSTASGTAVTGFSLATHRRWRDRGGQVEEATEWHSVVCFGRQAEFAGQYLARGRQVYVEGRIQTRSWEDAGSGETRYRTEIVSEVLQLLGQRPRDQGGSPAAPAAHDLVSEPEDGEAPLSIRPDLASASPESSASELQAAAH